jgi:hypothetical protein
LGKSTSTTTWRRRRRGRRRRSRKVYSEQEGLGTYSGEDIW